MSASTLETRECDEFPRAGTSVERALQVRTTPVASVGDILKAVGEEDRSDFHQSHLGRGGRKGLPWDWAPVSLKSKSWNWLGRFATAARSPILLCAHYSQESRKKKQVTALVATPTTPGAASRRACTPWLCLQRWPRNSTPSAAHFLKSHQLLVRKFAADRNRQTCQAGHATPGGDRKI